jgi:phage terminase Nu1 subunit (DNA packaging protein)
MTGVSVTQTATHFQVHPATVRGWIRHGCPCVVEGSVGRSHGSVLDLVAVARWRVAQLVPVVAARSEDDVLAVMATILWDSLKRDDLAGKTGIHESQAEHAALLIYERAHRNVKHTPLQRQDLPDELKRVCSNYLDFVERGTFQRR